MNSHRRIQFGILAACIFGFCFDEVQAAPELPFSPGAKQAQISFGDAEGNPAYWPEPIFHDGFTPWRQIAQNFDAIVFNTRPNAHGDVGIMTTPWAQYNLLRGADGFGVDAYYGRNYPYPKDAYQGIVAMGAIYGGTLAGIDYSAVHRDGLPPNLVRLVKKWFAADKGADMFLNNVHGTGGVDWWFDIYVNILACQLGELYRDKADTPGEPKLTELCRKSIDRWYEVTDSLRDGGTTPEFAYKAVQLIDGLVGGSKDIRAKSLQPIAACDTGKPGYRALNIQRHHDAHQICFGFPNFNGDTFESDSAGGIAYLGLLGYEGSHSPRDRQLADWALSFLDHTNYNPLYESMLPYGALASARMNAELGAHHQTEKLLGEIFSQSDVRYQFGVIGKSWGAAPAYGFVGGRWTGVGIAKPRGPDYAFALNTMEFAANLAPIPRYDPATARTLGKYLSHVAHNARYFYPKYLSFMDAPTARYIASAGEPSLEMALPFEGLKSKFPGQVENEPFGTGDALKANRHGAYTTDLGIYSGLFAGAMAKLFNPTAIENIYQIDLVGAEIPAPAAYPTYLLYNPYDQPKSTPVRADLIRNANPKLSNGDYFLYDAVSKKILARHVADDAPILIPAHESVVIVAVPETERLETVSGHLQTTGSRIVVDFSWRPK